MSSANNDDGDRQFTALNAQLAVTVGLGQEWTEHARAVTEGRLTFDPDKVNEAVGAINDAIGHLEDAKSALDQAGDVTGLGSYPSGIDLANKFNRKFDEGRGVLLAHIGVLGQMRDTILAAAAAYGSTDRSNTSKFGGAP